MKVLAVVARVAVGVLSLTSAARAEPTITVEQFKKLLEQVLVSDPEIVQAAVLRAQAKAEIAADLKGRAAASDLLKRAQRGAVHMPIVGSKDAPITIVEALDYQCQFCRIMHPRMKEILAQRSDVRIAILMTPIFGLESERLARFALAADQQGRFQMAHDALFTTNGGALKTDAELATLAGKIGVDWTKAKAAMSSVSVTSSMQDMKKDWESLNSPGTPLIIVNEKVVPGAVDTQELLDALPPVTAAMQIKQQKTLP